MGTIRHTTLTASLGGALVGASEWDEGHTFDLAVADITGLQAALDAKTDDADLSGYVTTSALTTALAGKQDALGYTAYNATNPAGYITSAALSGYLQAANNLSDLASAATARTNLGLAIGTDVQAYDADLAAIAALATQSFGRSLLTASAISDLRALGLQVQAVPRTVSGTSDTAVLTDAGGYIRCTSASATAVTIPPNSSVAYPTGTVITYEQAGAGTVTLTPGSGVTLNSRGALLALAGQYAVAQVKKVATDTWTVIGDVA